MNIREETLKIARNLIEKDPSLTDWVISKFPELKESEDVRMKNFISNELACIRATDGKGSDRYNELTEAIAWLKKQSEQKPIWSEEDSMHLTNAILAAEKEWGAESYTSKWLKSLKPQQWSGEDERLFDSVVWHLRNSVNNGDTEHSAGQLEYWLKSLRPQPKQKWSEEDSYMLGQAIKCVNNSGKLEVSTEEIEYWLESLKSQKQLKPSDQ